MTNIFRLSHLQNITALAATSRIPLDCLLRKYFKSNHSIGSHDRKFLTEILYKKERWKELITFLTQGDEEKELSLLESLDPALYFPDQTIPPHIRVSFPKEYFDLLAEQMGLEKALSFCFASNFPAPTTIRTNTAKIERQALFDKLRLKESVSLSIHSPLGIHFHKRVNFLIFPEFREGLFEVQDEASQLCALKVAVTPKQHVLDYCSGSGGKSLAIAPLMQGQGQLYLHDIRPSCLLEAQKRLKRAGIQNAQILPHDSPQKQKLLGKMDWVLVDAPCSGSGTLRRNPDMKWKFSKGMLDSLVSLQREIFSQALPFVKPLGHIVYATCSVFTRENEEQLAHFLQHFPVKLVGLPFSSLPSPGGMDGFYSVVLQKC